MCVFPPPTHVLPLLLQRGKGEAVMMRVVACGRVVCVCVRDNFQPPWCKKIGRCNTKMVTLFS